MVCRLLVRVRVVVVVFVGFGVCRGGFGRCGIRGISALTWCWVLEAEIWGFRVGLDYSDTAVAAVCFYFYGVAHDKFVAVPLAGIHV